MIDLYTWSTPDGWKDSVTLAEPGLPYRAVPIDITNGVQKTHDFLKINPNGRIPAIVGHNNCSFPVFESGAIMLYIAEKTGRLLPANTVQRSYAIQWLLFQMGGVGPMQGQAHVFSRYFPEQLPTVIARYRTETRRLYEALDRRLQVAEFLADEFSIADIAYWAWARLHGWAGVPVQDLVNFLRWIEPVEDRPAARKGICVPHPASYSLAAA